MDEIRERLDQIGADLKGQKELQTELLKSIKDLTSSLGVSRTLTTGSQSTKFAKKPWMQRAQSLQELESKMFEEFVASQLSGQLDHHPSMPSDAGIYPPPVEQGKPIEPIGSPKTLVSVIPGGPDAPDLEHSKAMPGVLPASPSSPSSPYLANREVMVSEREKEPQQPKTTSPRSSTSTKLRYMNERSQTHILGSLSESSALLDVPGPLPLDVGSKLILAMPRFLYFAIGFLLLCETVLAVACGPVHCPSHAGLRSTVVESITYGIAAAFSTASMKKALTSNNLKLATGGLLSFVAELHVDWISVSGKEGCKYAGVWLMMVLSLVTTRCLGTLHRLNSNSFVFDLTHEMMLNSMDVLSLLTYCASSALVTAAAYAQSHLLLGLDKSLDCWCSRILDLPDFRQGVQSWNALQALLKSIGRELAGTFLILQIFGSLCFMFFLVNGVILVFEDLDAIPWTIEVFSGFPLLFMSCLSLKVSAHGAALTEKCRAIPSFVNQIPTEESIDQERQYLVRYITDSSAGFCVRDVKLTQEMVMKQMYVVGAMLSATISALSRALI